jgi:hypothetical protein
MEIGQPNVTAPHLDSADTGLPISRTAVRSTRRRGRVDAQPTPVGFYIARSSSGAGSRSLRDATEPLREVGKFGRDRCPRVFAEDAGALRGDVGNRVVIARDERPFRQFVVEPSHARFGMSAGDVSGLRNLSAPALRSSSNSIRRFHISIMARSSGVVPKRDGCGLSSSTYRQMATDSAMNVPSSSSSKGILPIGFLPRYSGVRFSPFILSTSTVGNVTPFSARKMRTRLVLAPALRS